jgi:basic amino acid/polyamine antiporter, APA family
MDNNRDHKLLRVLTLKDAMGIGLGAIIGAGIFVVTGVAAGI